MTKTAFDYVITIGGEAGQGMQTLGVLLAKAFLKLGYHISTLQSYQSRIRGGHNYFQVRLASQPIHSMRNGIDLLIALDKKTMDEHCQDLSAGAVIIFDQGKIKSENACGDLLGVDMAQVFPETKEKEVFANIVYLGMLISMLGCPPEPVEELLVKTFGKKGQAIIDKNKAAFQAGQKYILNSEKWKERLPAPIPAKVRPSLTLHGNQAIALGAMAAECKFYSAYPMTPSTSVFETMATFAAKNEIVVEQAEDEIAALNMVLGATYAGVRAMTGTSGGGFALMVEALSLAGIIECPAVIVNSQRPGPATGLPTRTEQADLEFVIYSGHGEFPRVVLAPGSHTECYHLTIQAFNLADRYQIPVIILTDQYLADLYSYVEPFDASRAKIDRGKLVDPGPEYQRYQLTEDGISPRAIPGKGPGVVIVDSDEHTEDGHLTEDLEVRVKMNDKRLSKFRVLSEEMIMPEIMGQAKANAVICWGSTLGPCRDAVAQLQAEGKQVSLMHFKQVWPLNGEAIGGILSEYDHLICVEGNARGQFAHVLRGETSIKVDSLVLKHDGKMFMQDELVKEIGARLR